MTNGFNRRTMLKGGLALAATASLAACSRGGGGSSSSGALRYNTFLDPATTEDPRAVAQTAAIKEFERLNPDIKVEVVVDPASANVSRAIATRSGTPDVFRVQTLNLGQYAAQDGLMPLDELIDRDGVDRDDWLLSMELNKVEGTTFSLEQDYRIPIFMYHQNAFEQAGLDAPPKTIGDIESMASRLGGLAYPVGLGSSGGYFPAQQFLESVGGSLLMQASGGAYFQQDGLTPDFTEAHLEEVADAIQRIFASNASKPETLNWGYTEVHQALQSGSASSGTFGNYRFSSLNATTPDNDLRWAVPPGLTAGGRQLVYGYSLAINASSKMKDEAWEFIKFMTTAETQATLAQAGEVVARRSAYDDPFFKTPEASDIVGWKDLVESRGVAAGYSREYPAFGEVLSAELSRMVLQDTTPADAAAAIFQGYTSKVA
jgi:multiple sugar transport system substrate-binding protein